MSFFVISSAYAIDVPFGIKWTPVTKKVNGHSIIVSYYRVYVCDRAINKTAPSIPVSCAGLMRSYTTTQTSLTGIYPSTKSKGSLNMRIAAIDLNGLESLLSNVMTLSFDMTSAPNAPTQPIIDYTGQLTEPDVVEVDTVPPEVTVTAPLADGTVSGNTIISVDATDNVGVAQVEFLVDGLSKGFDTSSPFSTIWDTENGGSHPCAGYHTHSISARATDYAGNVGVSSNVSVGMNEPSYCDSIPPSAPANLVGTPQSSSQINLSWDTSSDNIGINGYYVERCQGASCSNFAQITAATGTTHQDTGLTAETTYQYRVRASDLAGNLSPYSNIVSVTTDAQPGQSELLQVSDFTYMGAFRITENWQPNYATMEYSNGAIAYYPSGDPSSTDAYPGSLFVSGHTYQEFVKEIRIPTPVISQNLGSLPTAANIRGFSDVDPASDEINSFIMGMAYVPSVNKVFYTRSGDYLDGDCMLPGSNGALGSFNPVTMANIDSNGYINVGGSRLHPYQSLRYIMDIPEPWSQMFSNRFIATGRHRGWCPEGSHLYASGPSSIPSNGDVAATRLMEFGPYDAGINYPWPASAHYPKDHSYANAYQGGAWLTAGSKAAVALSGTIDYDPGNSYYGYANWQSPNECEPSGTCVGGRGWRQADPRPALLLYNPQDFVDVANGIKQPWEPQWYARVDMSSHMLRNYSPTYLATGADAENILTAFDRTNGHLYVSESFVDGAKPIVHVFKIAN